MIWAALVIMAAYVGVGAYLWARLAALEPERSTTKETAGDEGVSDALVLVKSPW